MLFVKSNPSVKNYTVFCGNTSSTVADDTTSFAYVAGGALLPTGTPTANFKKRIRLPFEMRDGDVYSLFLIPPNDTYHDHLEHLPKVATTTQTFGMWWSRVAGSPTDIDVWFGKDGATHDTSWTSLNAAGWKWVFRATTLWGGSNVYPSRNGLTITQAEAQNYVAGDSVWVSENGTLYQYEAGSSETRDGLFVLNVLSGTGRLVAIAGKYARSEIIRGFSGNGIKFQENGGVEVGSVSDAGAWSLGLTGTNTTQHRLYGNILFNNAFDAGSPTVGVRRNSDRLYNYINGTASEARMFMGDGTVRGAWSFCYGGTGVGTSEAIMSWIGGPNSTSLNEVGYVTTSGAWVLGPSSGLDTYHTLRSAGNAGVVARFERTSGDSCYVRIAGTTNSIALGSNAGQTYMEGIYNKTAVGGVSVLINGSFMMGTTTSVREAKTNIAPLSSTLGWLTKLKPCVYQYRKQLDGKYTDEPEEFVNTGLIYDEVVQVNPQLCFDTVDGKPSGVEYTRLITPMLKAVQDLFFELEETKKRLAVLESAK